jgi:hypothetical protein
MQRVLPGGYGGSTSMMEIDPEYGEGFSVWDNEKHVPKPISIPPFIHGKRGQILLTPREVLK